MSLPTVFFIHGETSFFDANKSFFDFTNQDNYDLYCTETNPDPYSLGSNISNIITMQCGHYIHQNMLMINIFPSFPVCCNSNECLHDDSELCSKCVSSCVFVCDMCSNIISEPTSIKNVIENGIESIISHNMSSQLSNRKRKTEDTYYNMPNKKV